MKSLLKRFLPASCLVLALGAAVPTSCARHAAPTAQPAPPPAAAPAPAAPAPAAQPAAAPARAALPERLSDAEFWQLIADLSEPGGTFRSDNLLSNEVWLQYVIPDLLTVAKPGRVYMGVGPEQNFTYISALKPAMVFITDIRRGNLDLHLMYKALFEMSADRADFVARLFSRTRGARPAPTASAADLMAAAGRASPLDEAGFKANL